ncbi:MAG: IPT/TIG domain-containing protein [Bacteroidaceae bacterium]|nr:IPT/TIG domain-containing protein [Bacteroidaceae bacterium]
MITKAIKSFSAICLLCVLCVSCDNIVDYNDNYTSPEQLPNTGAPVILAVYDVADVDFSTPITQGTLNQTVVLVGENLNNVGSVKFNTVPCDMQNVYTMGTRAIVQIPSKLSSQQVNMIEYTTDQGTATYDFVIPFPDLTVESLDCEFTNAGSYATVNGQNFDLYDFESGVSTVSIGTQTLDVAAVTSTSMKIRIPEGTPENSQIVFNWETNGTAHFAILPFRPSEHLLFGDFNGITPNIDGSVQMAIEDDSGVGADAWLNQKNLHFTGSYPAWSWNTIDFSCNMIDQVIENVENYVFKMEVLTQSDFPLTEQTGLQFCFNWGDSYAWNPGDGAGINTFGQWKTVTLPLAPMATKGISAPGSWQTLRITFQPHAAYDADFRLANFRIAKK